jgi:hypothetical protein
MDTKFASQDLCMCVCLTDIFAHLFGSSLEPGVIVRHCILDNWQESMMEELEGDSKLSSLGEVFFFCCAEVF